MLLTISDPQPAEDGTFNYYITYGEVDFTYNTTHGIVEWSEINVHQRFYDKLNQVMSALVSPFSC